MKYFSFCTKFHKNNQLYPFSSCANQIGKNNFYQKIKKIVYTLHYKFGLYNYLILLNRRSKYDNFYQEIPLFTNKVMNLKHHYYGNIRYKLKWFQIAFVPSNWEDVRWSKHNFYQLYYAWKFIYFLMCNWWDNSEKLCFECIIFKKNQNDASNLEIFLATNKRIATAASDYVITTFF